MTITIDVNTADLRKALQAVSPHTADDPAFGNLCGVHFTVTDQNVFVMATNTYSAALGIASVWEHDGLTGNVTDDSFDLDAGTVKELLQLFRPSKNHKDDDGIGDALRITVETGKITFLDVSGLFPGKTFAIPTSPGGDYPNIPGLLMGGLASDVDVPARIVTQAGLIRLFAAAGSAYRHPLTIEPTGEKARMLISCGESFLGMLMPIRAEDGDELANDLRAWRDGWLDRLPDVVIVKKSADWLKHATGLHVVRNEPEEGQE